jgi:probable phosphoglycerate mutase
MANEHNPLHRRSRYAVEGGASIWSISNMKRIFLLRHGEFSYLSRDGRVTSYTGKGLSQNGIRQMESLASIFIDIPVDGIYASPLERTVHSANIIAAVKSMDVELVPELKEIDIGSGDGKTIEEILRICPEFMKDPAAKLPSGENFYDLAKRCLNGYHKITKNSKPSVIIVSHAAVNRVILCHALSLDLSRFGRIEQDAACINIIDYFGEFPIVKLLNYTHYDVLKKALVGNTLDLESEIEKSR